MRALLTFSLLTSALATPVHAQWAGDRYGFGPAPKSAAAAAPSAMAGRVLSWSNKLATASPLAVSPSQNSSYEARAQNEPTPPLDSVPQRIAALSPAPDPASRPFARQPVQRFAPAPRSVELAGGPTEPPQYARPEQPIRQVATAGTSGQARYYSLHREYGLAPDAIPEQPTGARYVLIGPSPSDELGRDNSEDHDSPEGASDKPF